MASHPKQHERQLDQTVADSFPASDPPSHSGITGVGGRAAPDDRNKNASRSASHKRGKAERPTGQPTSDRHATETAHSWEDQDRSE